MVDLKNKTVTIIGLARSGMAAAELIHHSGGRIKISEKAPLETLAMTFQNWPLRDKVATEFGGHTSSFIEQSDLVVLSPGVRWDASFLDGVKAKGIPIWGEVELAYRFCSKPIIAITGSNGKTTVSTLIKDVLEKKGKRVCLCGNMGSPFSKYIFDLEDKDLVVLEISSFQLESIVSFRPHVAVFLNFSQNHLDRHKDIEEYFDAKKRIFLNQASDDFAVLNFQDERVKSLAREVKARVVFFDRPSVENEIPIGNPNHSAVMEVAKIFGILKEICFEVFRQFKGVEHRLEWVRSIDGVDFINDSKATTAEATRWALDSIQRPILLICGGRDKNIDFSVLRDIIPTRVKKIFVIGEAREKIRRAFEDMIVVEECGTLDDAVTRAKASAQQGDSVVLSPMCASFDMFVDFEERGRVFKDIVCKF